MDKYDTLYMAEVNRCKANIDDKMMVYRAMWILGLLVLFAGIFI